MNLQEFTASVDQKNPPHGIGQVLTALWEDAKGHWDTAHSIVQKLNSIEAMSVHAYLHREEGDLSNASYWYHRVNKAMPKISLQEEWQELATQLLQGDFSA